ncbi:MAG: DUF4271 domain-containing protein [Saprospiraceae bacterium]|nr:DUF4271 domain-containing protein [Saprospiraceae bacterium]
MRKGFQTLWLCLLFTSWVSTTLPGQNNNTNPFEVSGRIDNTAKPITNEPAQIDTSRAADNPFEVNHVPLRRQQLKPVQSPLQEISRVKPKVSNSFIFWIMIFSWAILAVVITNKTSLISFLVRSMFNINMMKLTKRDEAGGYNFHFALLYLGFFINMAVFVYLWQKYFGGPPGIKTWTLCFISITAIYVVRHLFMWLLGNIFPVSKESSLYSYSILVFNILLGLFIIPLNLLLAYGPETIHLPMLYFGLGIIVLFYILRSIRGLSISLFLIGQGIVPFFIYLCTAEIAPFLVLIRVVSNIQG